MLLTQLLEQKARELALHYVSTESLTPEEYHCKVNELQAIFLEILINQDA